MQVRNVLKLHQKFVFLRGDKTVAYSVRPMRREDIAQVTEIDREAFPTQLPPANYRHELQNQLAHYIVVCDDNTTVTGPELEMDSSITRLATKIRRWLKHSPAVSERPAPPKRKYIVGFAGIWVMADEAHITNIAVRQRYQHRGIGALLLTSIIDLAQELRASMMTLEVRASNIIAQKLYRKYGFEQAGIRHGYYLDNREDGIIMSTESITSATFQARLKNLRDALARKRML